MRIAATLVVRDEAELLQTWLPYHFAQGVDVVIATDHRSVDGTTDLLRDYEQEGRVVLIREHGDVLQQAEWVTRMARLAATEHGADWVINSDADEFWWPCGGTFAEILAPVPRRFGVVRGLMRHFVLRPGGEPFLERMTIRARPTADLSSPYHAQVKVAHRAVLDAVVSTGNHDVTGTGLLVLREWFPFEVLHFPLRSREQLEEKFLRRVSSPDGQHIVNAIERIVAGEGEELARELLVDDGRRAAGLAAGTLVEDTRLRDAVTELRATGTITAASPTPADDLDLALDGHIALEHDSAVILENRCQALEHSVAELEHRAQVAARIGRRLRSAAPGGGG
jgi:glycosyl transferase family 2